MVVGQACTCQFGVTSPTRKQRLLDLIQAFAHEDERQRHGGQVATQNCGAPRSLPSRNVYEEVEEEFRPRPAAGYRGDRV